MYIKCPLNYTGGKYKILPSIFAIIPQKVNTFVDLFAGGFNVGINANANKIVCNDQITYIIDLYRFLEANSSETVIKEIKSVINQFELSQVNVEGYNALRERYNDSKSIIDFFVLTCFSFNHQIRFNNKQQFNTPFGRERSSYNSNIERNLIAFCDALHKKNIEFRSNDFLKVDLSNLGENDLVYCDPPYLISTGSYNDGKRGFKDWTEREELELLDLLDNLNNQGVRFALSNVLYHKGLTNNLLIKWSKKYYVFYIDKTYSNCNYQFKERNAKTVEVLIINFPCKNYKRCEQGKFI